MSNQAAELPKAYRPSDHEERVRGVWEVAGAFRADPGRVASGERRPFAVVIPPPNVTARLHLGHALNNTLQDVLVRAHRLMGFEALWMPGTDHAGIATQAVVERRLWEEEKKRRHDLGREAFVERVGAWKDDYERQITDQLKLMGCSCDFGRQRFTMDGVCARAVREAFFRLFRDGLIYRGKRLVNWDPALQTAVADDECFEEEVESKFYYLRYPLVHDRPGDAEPVTWDELAGRGFPGAGEHPADQPAWVTVATTRPETYVADTAVAVNPHDPRAGALRGLSVELPLVGRVVPVVEDSYVVLPEALARTEEEKNDPKARFATGFLKVTPAHDKNDWEIGVRHRLAVVNMMSPDGRVSDAHGWTDVGDARVFVGLTMVEAREKVVAEFRARGLLEKVTPYRQTLTYSDRSKAVVEPYLSDQWYVRVTDERLAASANRALTPEQRGGGVGGAGAGGDGDGAMTFFPARYAKTFEQWHAGIRDWCISRQLWWGHRIPVWHRRVTIGRGESPSAGEIGAMGLDRVIRGGEAGGVVRVRDAEGREVPAAELLREDAANERVFDVYVCYDGNDPGPERRLEQECGFTQDPDVLDTWFSSALWPMSTMGWPDPARAASETGDPSMAGLLEAFNPTSVLCTAREIITLWVSRMTMFNRYLLGEDRGAGKGAGPVPFRHVYIHAVVQDGEGQKMSKSLGNGVDPIDIIQTHGSDAMRFTLCHMATQTQDVRMPVDILDPFSGEAFAPKMITNAQGARVAAPVQEHKGRRMVSSYGVASGEARPTSEMPAAKNTSSKFDLGRNFANKLWNASRFTLSILDRGGAEVGAGAGGSSPGGAALADRWMKHRLARAAGEIEAALSNYEFAGYAQSLYRVVWDDFCDWYLEAIKPTVGGSAAQRATLAASLRSLLTLAHPVMPFITEVVWESLAPRLAGLPAVDGVRFEGGRGDGSPLCVSGWPRFGAGVMGDEAAGREFDRVRSLVTAVREVRAQHGVLPKRKITLHAPDAGRSVWAGKEEIGVLIRTLGGVETITDQGPGGPSVLVSFESGEWRLSDLADAVDAGAEEARLRKVVADLERSIATLRGRLSNPGYAERAPASMVQQTKDQLAKAESEVDSARSALKALGAG
ncbi:MAG: valine--tRNA ligase [Phycisphaeraceae bacterium]|nr:MAG: valine--tRNA ligase [Phycisphaeraceae bacterium]